jgi:hypothetical protein
MRVIDQLIDYLSAVAALSAEDRAALTCGGFLAEEFGYSWDEEDGEYSGAESPEGWSLEEAQEVLARIRARRGKPLWRVGRSRKRWWKGFQVTQLARARRLGRQR